jgi:hypothetical protein
MIGLNKKGQAVVFVIIAILLVGTIVVIYSFRDKLMPSQIPADFVPVFSNYESCIKQEAQAAISVAGTQGGRVDPGEYVPGSEYAPFSSQLNFLGFPVPYWYYVSGNGIVKENVPTLASMESDIADFVSLRLGNCNFENFYHQGFDVSAGTPTVKVKITDTNVNVQVSANVNVVRGEESAVKSSFSEDITSKLGKFYSTAVDIYNDEKKNAVFEKYAVDTLWNYAPVDGVEIDCSPKVWKTRDIQDELKQGLEANMGAIKYKGSYYTLKNKQQEYYVVNMPVDSPVSLLYSRNWPTKIEMYGQGVDDELVVAEPVGNEAGLGVMGFCYIPYHYIYDVSFPVMVQIHEGTELFQFPMAVIIDKNQPRQAEVSPDFALGISEEFDLCKYKTQDVAISVYDVELRATNANLSYSCFNQKCSLGETEKGVFNGKAPACVNGQIIARAAGYKDNVQLFSSNSESSADVILDKEYKMDIKVEKGGQDVSKTGATTIVIFTGLEGKNESVSATIPGSEGIKLSQGYYSVSVYVYDNASITVPKTVKRQCYDTSAGGIFGFFGQTEEKCVNIEIPETTLEGALTGGGKSEVYLLPSDLEKGKITLKVDSFKKPKTIEELGQNFAKFDAMNVEVLFG